MRSGCQPMPSWLIIVASQSWHSARMTRPLSSAQIGGRVAVAPGVIVRGTDEVGLPADAVVADHRGVAVLALGAHDPAVVLRPDRRPGRRRPWGDCAGNR